MKVKRIDKLTPEQEAAMPGWRDKYIAYGLACGKADRARVESGITRCYEFSKLPSPRFEWVGSPMAAQIRANELVHGVNKNGKPKEMQFIDWFGGRMWCSFEAWYTFFTEVCGLDLGEKAKLADAYTGAMCGGYWVPLSDVCICAEVHTELHRNADGQLHNESGMSISWPDGWGLYSIDGVTVGEKIVMRPQELTSDEVMKMSNADARAIAIRRMGITKYIIGAKAKLIDIDEVPVYADKPDGPKISRALFEANGQRFFIGGDGSTDRIYDMPVFSGAMTCREAHEQIAGCDESLIWCQS